MDRTLVQAMADNWWIALLRGIAAILFGIVALFWPGLTVFVLLITFGVYAVFDGVLAIFTAFQRKNSDDQWWLWALEGLFTVIIGLMALFWPIATALAFVFWMAVWAIFAGLVRIVSAIRLRKEIEGEWALIFSGALLVVWGILMAMVPVAGMLGFAWMIGAFSIIIGVLLISLSFRLKAIKGQARL